MTDDEPTDEPKTTVPVVPRSNYRWLFALVVLVLIALISVSLLRYSGGRGARGILVGAQIPPFAAPLVTSSVDGDANLARKANSGAAGKVPACSIHQPGVVTSCELTSRRPLVLAFATQSRRCVQQLDELERMAAFRRGQVDVAAVAVRGNRDKWRRLVAGRWSFPVAYDRDGALAAAYDVEICPQTTFVRHGGRAAGTAFGELSDVQLALKVRQLLLTPTGTIEGR